MEFHMGGVRYPVMRNPVYGRRGMVSASQPLAAQAGISILKRGGNAVDAAIAAAACLAVTEPTSNGIGGDCFVQVWRNGRLYALNASGPAPALLSADVVREQDFDKMPERGWLPVTVPGVPAAWAELNERFGRLSLREDFDPAINCARRGFPVESVTAACWREAGEKMAPYADREEFKEWFRVFTKNGRTPEAGEIWGSEDIANTLESIAESRGLSFYHWTLADKIDAFSQKTGGLLRKKDLESYRPHWVDPVCVSYRGYDVWELPPNGQGLVALMALGMLEQTTPVGHDDVRTIHQQIEALKLAFADGQRYIADPDYAEIPVEEMVSETYLKQRASLIGDRAVVPAYGNPYSGGTVHLCAADEEGTMVSLIQSNYEDFGSGIVVPGTGINLQDRGCNFSLDQSCPNYLAPGKRPYHTIIPGFLTKDEQAVGAFGVTGAFMQAQGHVQALMNMIDFHMNPQEALNAPRWQWKNDLRVEVEAGFDEDVVKALRQLGHIVEVAPVGASMGRGQIIIRNDNGVYVGGCEPRADGCVAVW